jgi:hypothetical protein
MAGAVAGPPISTCGWISGGLRAPITSRADPSAVAAVADSDCCHCHEAKVAS